MILKIIQIINYYKGFILLYLKLIESNYDIISQYDVVQIGGDEIYLRIRKPTIEINFLYQFPYITYWNLQPLKDIFQIVVS